MTLYSAGFWWLAAGCQDGQFRFAAWTYPDPGFARLGFAEILFAHDATGVPVRPPHAIVGDPLQERGGRRHRALGQRFALTVHQDGIGRLLPPL
jgi:hypothetical protein